MPDRSLSCTPSLNRAAESGMVNVTSGVTQKWLRAKCRVGSELHRRCWRINDHVYYSIRLACPRA
jgi:predicted transcriptional regulator